MPARDGGHHHIMVYRAMLLQVVRDYSGLPDFRTLRQHEIRVLFEGLRDELKKGSKPQPNPASKRGRRR